MSAFAAATSSPAGHHPRLFFWRENRNDGAYGVPGNHGTYLGSWVTFVF